MCDQCAMSAGYIYCFANDSMPGILKCGMTTRTPPDRLKEANHSDTWRPPTPFYIAFAKRVANPMQKEAFIHNQLHADRIHARREFFRVTQDRVRGLFDQIEGTVWVPTSTATSTVPRYFRKHPHLRTPSMPSMPDGNWITAPFTCPCCNNIFETYASLKTHIFERDSKWRDILFSPYFPLYTEFSCDQFNCDDVDFF